MCQGKSGIFIYDRLGMVERSSTRGRISIMPDCDISPQTLYIFFCIDLSYKSGAFVRVELFTVTGCYARCFLASMLQCEQTEKCQSSYGQTLTIYSYNSE